MIASGRWRTGEDSNLRDDLSPTRFPSERHRPLGHLSNPAGKRRTVRRGEVSAARARAYPEYTGGTAPVPPKTGSVHRARPRPVARLQGAATRQPPRKQHPSPSLAARGTLAGRVGFEPTDPCEGPAVFRTAVISRSTTYPNSQPRVRATRITPISPAGVAGIEPAHAGVKGRCRTAWLHPNPCILGCPPRTRPRLTLSEGGVRPLDEWATEP